MDRVKFDISGQIYTITRNQLQSGPDSRVKELCHKGNDVIFIDRPPDVFMAILAMYQTGDLHIPKACCLRKFLQELDFWDIAPDNLATCCYFRVQKFLNQQRHLSRFKLCMSEELARSKRTISSSFPTLDKVRNKIWAIVDNGERTPMAALYFTISLTMVLLSICNMAFSTDPRFKRNLTDCERYEFMSEVNMEGLDLVAPLLRANCVNESQTKAPNDVGKEKRMVVDNDLIIEISVKAEEDEPCDVTTTDSTSLMAFFNYPGGEQNKTQSKRPCGVPFGARRMPEPPVLKRIKIPNFTVPYEVFGVLELITVTYFTVDIMLRLVTCPSLIYFTTSVVNVADMIALLGVYLNWTLNTLRPKEEFELNWFDLLEYLQMLRSFRLFRLLMSFDISKILIYSVRQSMRNGLILILFLISGMCIFSTGLYLAEDKLTVGTMPEAWYWTIITMTTVGYGDIVPKTAFGRFVACVCSVAGVLVFSLTVPLFVNQFMLLHQYTNVRKIKTTRKSKPKLASENNTSECMIEMKDNGEK